MTSNPDRQYCFTYALQNIIRQLQPDEVEELRRELDFYVEEFTRLKQAHAHNPLGLAASIHEAIDGAVERRRQKDKSAKEISCRKGCSYCCSVHVGIMPIEASLLLEYAKEQQLTLDAPRMSRQLGHTHEDWLALAEPDRRCVFLQPDGTCGVYAHRPLSCRKYFVVDDPMKCKQGVAVWNWVAPEAEIMATAALTVFGMVSMAQGLTEG